MKTTPNAALAAVARAAARARSHAAGRAKAAAVVRRVHCRECLEPMPRRSVTGVCNRCRRALGSNRRPRNKGNGSQASET